MKALFAFAALSVCGTALATDDAAVLRCRAISDLSGRVACYDAMPLSGAVRPASGPAVAPAAVTTTATVATATTAATTAAASPEQNFGLSGIQLRQQNNEPNAISSTLLGHIEGWGPSTRFTLANGQIWRVADDSQASIVEMDNPKVKLVRNGLGTIFLEIEGTNQSPRVRRVQ
jgi:hypothetical protein